MSAQQGRVVRVGGADLHFVSVETLEARIETTKQKLLAIENGVLSREPRNADAWRQVERHAAELRDLLFGLQPWLEETEAALDREIEEAREWIRALST